MSLNEINDNTTLEYFPTEIRVNKSSYFKNNQNSSTISHSKNIPNIYGYGVDDYVSNEIKKAKYQGCFDPGSLGNKNIFNDSHYNINNNRIIFNEENKKSNLIPKNQKKLLDKNKKYQNNPIPNVHKYEEGKNLLIAKTEIHYPLTFDRYNYVLTDSNRRKNNKSIDLNSGPPTIKRKFIKNKNNSNQMINYTYFTPIYDGRKIANDEDFYKYHNRALAMSTLMNNYNESSKIMNKTRNNRYINYSKDKTNGSNMNSHNRENYLSPVVISSRFSAYDPKYINNIKKNKNLYTINISDMNNDDIKKYSYNQLKRNDINNTNQEEFDRENFEKENLDEEYNYNYTNEDEKFIFDKIANKDDIKLINKYREKLLSLFIMHMSIFYYAHLRKNIIDFIEKLKCAKKIKEYNFENKVITNISEIKKMLISNSFHYGHNKEYTNLLKDIKNKKNLINKISKNKKSKYIVSYSKNYLENDYPNLNRDLEENKKLIRKKYILNNNNTINNSTVNKKVKIISNKAKNKDNKYAFISSKKYIKKNISKKNLGKYKQEISINNQEITVKKEIINNNNILNENNKEDRKKIQSVDRTLIMIKNSNNNPINNKKILKTYKTSDIIKKTSEIRPHFFKKVIPNSFNNINNNTNNNTKNQNQNVSNTNNVNNNKLFNSVQINRQYIYNKKNKKVINYKLNEKNKVKVEQKNNLKFSDVLKGKTLVEKINMSLKYLDADNNNKNLSSRDKNNINQQNFKIENAYVHTFIGSGINENYLEENEEKEPLSNSKLQNALSIITKIMENKEKNDENSNLRNNLLLKIIQDKISKDEKQNFGIIKKYFDIMKCDKNQNKEKTSNKQTKNFIDLEKIPKIEREINDFPMEQKLLSDNDKLVKDIEKNINRNKNKNVLSKNDGKFTVVIRKIKMHRNKKHNKLRPIQSAKNSLTFITDIDNIPAKNIMKKTVSLKINKISKSVDKINTINKERNKEIIDDKEKKEYEKKENCSEVEENIGEKKEENKEEIQDKKEEEAKEEMKENVEKKEEEKIEKEVKNKDEEIEKEENEKLEKEIEIEKKEIEKEEKIIENIGENIKENKEEYKDQENKEGISIEKEEKINKEEKKSFKLQDKNIGKEENIIELEKKNIEKEEKESIEKELNNEGSKDKNDIDTISEKNLFRNFKLVKKSKINKDRRKSLVAIPRLKKSIESFTQYRKERAKLNKNKESDEEGEITLNEKYQNCENLIYYLRTQLILYFLSNSKNNETFND